MKLILCKSCQDIVRPYPNKVRSCECGKITVEAVGSLNIEVSGKKYATPLGFRNSSFRMAVINQPEIGMGQDFVAFVIPKQCDSIKYID
jgi:hypothetical protein